MARGRPATPIGTFGDISARQLPNGRWQGNARYRAQDGTVRQVRANGKTAAEAKRRTRQRALDMSATNDTPELSTSSTVAALLEHWHAHHDAATSSMDVYRSTMERHVIPGVGQLRLNEASTARIDAFLRTLGEQPATAKRARTVLSSAFGLAARYGLVTHNPVRDTASVTVPRGEARALTPDELAAVRSMVDHYANRAGRKRAQAFPRVVDVLAGTGARISEVLRLQWADVDLDATPATAVVTVTKDGGTSTRTVQLPAIAADALRAQAIDVGGFSPWCFPTSTGRALSKSNVERWFRRARETWAARDEVPADEPDVSWVTPHTFRRTVATLLADRASLLAASQQLGHADTTITEHHYLERPKAGPPVASILDEALGVHN